MGLFHKVPSEKRIIWCVSCPPNYTLFILNHVSTYKLYCISQYSVKKRHKKREPLCWQRRISTISLYERCIRIPHRTLQTLWVVFRLLTLVSRPRLFPDFASKISSCKKTAVHMLNTTKTLFSRHGNKFFPNKLLLIR